MKDWTIMVYMSGDNNLSQDMVTGLSGLKDRLGDIPENIAILAYYDSGALDTPPVYLDFTRTLHIEPVWWEGKRLRDGKTSKLSLQQFVRWCVKKKSNRAEKYALILSGHGDGFQHENFLRDESSDSYISMRKLGDALQRLITGVEYGVKRQFKPVLERPLSILGFDSCVMGSLEVAKQLDDSAETIVASQGFVPNAGWNYGRIIDGINGHRIAAKTDKIERSAMAEIFAKAFIDNYRDYSLFSGVSVDIGICDLTAKGHAAKKPHFSTVVKTLDSLAGKLRKALDNASLGPRVTQAILNAHWRCQTYLWEQCIDVKDFCELLITECKPLEPDLTDGSEVSKLVGEALEQEGLTEKARAALKRVATSLENQEDDDVKLAAIVDDCKTIVEGIDQCTRSYNLGAELQYSTGLSLYFPWSLISFYLTWPLYTKLSFSDPRSKWIAFLQSFLQQTFRMPKLRSGEIKYLFDADGSAMKSTDLEFFMLNTFGDLYLPFEIGEDLKKIGQPQVKIGQPQVKIGQPQVKIGQPQVRIGQPQVRIGQPQVRIGQPQVKLNQPSSVSDSRNFSRTKNFPWAPRLWDLESDSAPGKGDTGQD